MVKEEGFCYASIKLRGANSRTSTLTFNLGAYSDLATDATVMQSKLAALVTAIGLVTDAVTAQSGLYFVESASGVVGSGDLYDKATVAVHLNDAAEVEKLHGMVIPAAKQSLFVGSTGLARDTIDVDNADLQSYVSAVATNALVSDGETIKTAVGTGGIAYGSRDVRKFKAKNR